jgi:large subunit ribosomal protein L29
MKGTKPGSLREKAVEELSKLASEKAENLFNLKVRRAAGNLESSADIQATRRDLARVKTVLGEKQRAAAAGTKTP